MLAEIYMLRLEAAARTAKEAATSTSRFVPVSVRARWFWSLRLSSARFGFPKRGLRISSEWRAFL
jgi:hypothetical protein